MTIDKEKINSEYTQILQEAYDNIDTLTPAERATAIETAKKYYEYLASNGIIYGKIALEVLENKGRFGEMANINMKDQSIFDGVPPSKIPEMTEKLAISLAYRDSDMRGKPEYIESDRSSKEIGIKIGIYHKEAFEKYSTPYAWAGLATDELIGVGEWERLYVENTGVFEGAIEIWNSGKLGETGSQYSKERMVQSLKHTYRVYSTKIEVPFTLHVTAASKEQELLNLV